MLTVASYLIRWRPYHLSRPRSRLCKGPCAQGADPATVAGADNLREALDLDSMDFMNFVVALHERTGIDIPEADYPRLRTLNGAIAYLGR
jgi:acyl carrier protein